MKHHEVLGLVNKARIAIGEKPLHFIPPGNRNTLTQCPLARALSGKDYNVVVRSRSVSFHDPEKAKKVAQAWGTKTQRRRGSTFVKIPNELADFVQKFDRGEFPHLHLFHIVTLIDAARGCLNMELIWSSLRHDPIELLNLIPGLVTDTYCVFPPSAAKEVARVWKKRVNRVVVLDYDDNGKLTVLTTEYRVPLPGPLRRFVRWCIKDHINPKV